MSARLRGHVPAQILAGLALWALPALAQAPPPAQGETPPPTAATVIPQAPLPEESFVLDVLGGWQKTGGDEDAAMFLKYQDIGEPFALPRLYLRVHAWDTEMRLDMADAGEDDQFYRLGARAPGLFAISVGYDELPHHISDFGSTLYTVSGGDRLLIPDHIQRTLQNAAFRLSEFLRQNAHSVDIETDRKTVRARGSVSLFPGFTLSVMDEEEERRGILPRSVSTTFQNGADVDEFPDPIHYDTRRAGVGLEYRFGPAWVSAGADIIEFSNLPNRLVVDNPLRADDAQGGSFGNRSARRFLVSTPPDNEARSFRAGAGVALPWNMRIAGTFERGRVTADVPLPPFTLNKAIRANPFYPVLPVGTSDGKIDTTRYDVAFTGTPVRWLSFRAFARGYEYDNESPSIRLPGYVVADTTISTLDRRTLPYGWERKGEGVDLRVRPLKGLALGVGLARESVDRTFREVNSSDEDTLRFAADYSFMPWLSLHGDVEHSERTADNYDAQAYLESFPDGVPGDQVRFRLLKRYDVASRDRDGFGLSGTIDFGSGWAVDFASRQWKDDYVDSNYGMVDEGFRSKLVGLTMKPHPACELRAELADEFGTRRLNARFRPLLSGAPVDARANDWSDEISDNMHTVSGGLACRDDDNRWDYNVWIDTSTDRQDDDAAFTSHAVVDPLFLAHAKNHAPIRRHVQRYTGYVRFEVSRHLNMVLNALYEKFDEEDPTQDLMIPTMGSFDSAAFESAFLGVHVNDYSTRVFSVLIDAHW